MALPASPPTPAPCWLGSHLTVDFFPANTEEVKDKGKNSWDLIACATSDKLESPKEAAIDLYLCLYVTWVLSLCNFPGTSTSKFNKIILEFVPWIPDKPLGICYLSAVCLHNKLLEESLLRFQLAIFFRLC